MKEYNVKVYEIVGLDIGQVGGCGCWSDILIFIKRIEE